MKRSALRIVWALSAFCATGCVAPSPTAPPPRYSITGVGSLSASAPGRYNFVELDGVHVNGAGIRKPFLVGDVLKTEQLVRLDIYEQTPTKTFDYRALVGPDLKTGRAARIGLTPNDPSTIVGDGWSFMWDEPPNVIMTQTDWVSAAADSTIVVQVDSSTSPATHRIYLLAGSSVTVTCKNGGGATTLNEVGKYVNITSPCSLSAATPKLPIAGAPADIQNFIAKVKGIACEAGWPDASCPP